ncbi:speedy protein A-like [Cyrtonyx montezumae]|uniref:speedy protein A-like n=1 Tax=Cyrtonyx montezumae TaxID=9017 RepID=UPI0032DA0396
MRGRSGRGRMRAVFRWRSLRRAAVCLLTLLWMFLEPLISAVQHGLRCLTPSAAQEKARLPHQQTIGNRSKRRSRKRKSHRGGRRKRRAQKSEDEHPEKPCLDSRQQEVAAFLQAFEDDYLLRGFLQMDRCCRAADKYLLAMTFVYLKRANLCNAEHMRLKIFAALYLAHTVEEEDDETKYEIFPWALGKNWRKLYPCFLKFRDLLWRRTGYRAIVSKRSCEKVMAFAPSHYIWRRGRPAHHSGARRAYAREQVQLPRGPGFSPLPCSLCGKKGRFVRVGLRSSSSSSNST